MNSLQERILSVCNQYCCANWYIAPDIPVKKLRNLCENVQPAKDVKIYALIDETVFGNAKNGMLVASDGLYIHNDTVAATPGRHFLSWDMFLANAERGYPSSFSFTEVALAPAVKYNGINKKRLMAMLTELLAVWRTHFAEEKKRNATLVSLQSFSARRCQYCDTVVTATQADCPSCGAPIQ